MGENNDKKLKLTVGISLAFVLLFVAIRNAPVEPCEVLHYGDYMNEEGAVENCGDEETSFFDMTKVRYPVEVKLQPQGEVVPGETATFDLYLHDHMGKGINYEDIVVSHTERIHLMAVDPSLTDYQHLHPQPAGAPGHYQFQLNPSRSGTYKVYLDFISLISQRRVLAKSEFNVEGSATGPKISKSTTYPLDGYTFKLQTPSEGSFPAGEESQLELSVLPREGNGPVDFGLVMGAYAHLVVFDEDGKGFAHLHPQNPFVEEQDPNNPDLRFNFFPADPGKYRLWAQLVVDGQERFVPFDLEVVEDV
ncbi:hypothetical protein DDZ13_13110 [Coraliomargarita sinensis]|uniref:YtkA-like domain-containing protein n=1 Tax=Coraliomargarita sinensis TaxID=2174842 RepID=A0A317ZGT2_9BACT|nr:hypothetical protein [Coraliomargarita sinensis]PXA03158.1 hypothetical protein DDZ13_13110 [Coraliomargarita sinensis]